MYSKDFLRDRERLNSTVKHLPFHIPVFDVTIILIFDFDPPHTRPLQNTSEFDSEKNQNKD